MRMSSESSWWMLDCLWKRNCLQSRSRKLKKLKTPLLIMLLSLQPKLQLRRNNDYGRHKSRSNEC